MIKKMLEYQAIDRKVFALENDKEFAQLFNTAKKLESDGKEKLVSVEGVKKSLEELYAELEKLSASLDAAITGKDNYDVDISTFSSIEEFEKVESDFAKFEESIHALSREINKNIKKIADYSAENARINTTIDGLEAQLAKYKAAANQKYAEIRKEITPIKEQLSAIETTLDKALLEKYKGLRRNAKCNVFVAYADGSCRGCGVEVAVDVGDKLLKSGDMADCPHCGRVLFVP